MKIPVLRLDFALPLPKHQQEGDAGVDLHAREDIKIEAGEWKLVPTGVAMAVPEGYVGLIAPRSGLALRSGIGVVNGPGVLDSGYRGELKVILINHGQEEVTLERGERIAQLVVVPATEVELVEVDELPDSGRGEDGFGSTGSQ
jgi:dUTP pyrophosphatase